MSSPRVRFRTPDIDRASRRSYPQAAHSPRILRLRRRFPVRCRLRNPGDKNPKKRQQGKYRVPSAGRAYWLSVQRDSIAEWRGELEVGRKGGRTSPGPVGNYHKPSAGAQQQKIAGEREKGHSPMEVRINATVYHPGFQKKCREGGSWETEHPTMVRHLYSMEVWPLFHSESWHLSAMSAVRMDGCSHP